MAVTDDRIYHPTNALILRTARRHFGVNLRHEHWQLRSMIGLSSRYIFYVCGAGNTQIHKLDTTSQENEVIKLLTFAPRCLVARNGWVCCGGENGEFVAFQTNDESPDGDDRSRTESSSDSEPMRFLRSLLEEDASQPGVLAVLREYEQGRGSHNARLRRIGLMPDNNQINPDDWANSLSLPTSGAGQDASSDNTNHHKCLVARSKTFGKERVNCVTLWFPSESFKGSGFSGAYTQAVAVLANNDKHVTIVDLEDQKSLDQLSYPDYVNRAVLSPDGRLLAAICDDPYLYVHERVPQASDSTYEWSLCAKIHLSSQRKEDRTDQRGSFAACFSNTGRYLAVGTQYGVISVFDTEVLSQSGSDPLITIFTSSRPRQDMGAIREMAFCPGPFDLLAWTEHRGRVGVADIRSNYMSRQILDLSEYDDFEHVTITERGSIDPRLLERNDRNGGESGSTDAGEGSGGRRGARRATAAGDSFTLTLGAAERSALEALDDWRGSRLAGTRLIERFVPRGTLNATSAARDAGRPGRDWSSPYRRQEDNSTVSDTVDSNQTSILSQQALESALSYITTHRPSPSLPTTRSLLRSMQRVQASLAANSVVSLSREQAEQTQGEQQTWEDPSEGAEPGSQLQRSRENAASQLALYSHLRAAREQDTHTATLERINRARLAEARAAMQHANRVEHCPDDTLGLAWSEDGRTLYIGAEDGIYEFHVDMLNRKAFSSITMR